MTTTITVENCAGCMFHRSEYKSCACEAVWKPLGKVTHLTSPPDWRPLRTADRLVQLRVK